MEQHRLRFEVPKALALRVMTTLADAGGVELVSSERPVTVDDNTVVLNAVVEGELEAVARAVASVRSELPPGATIEVTDS
jgi:hypothetical protein